MRMFLAVIAAVAGFAPSTAGAPGAPVITSVGKHVYVNGMTTNLVGTPGVFRLSDPGSTVTSYLYSLEGSDPDVSVSAGKDGTAKLAITPNTLNQFTLVVEAVNASGPGPASTFQIDVGAKRNTATLAWWKLSGPGRTAADATGNGNTAGLSGDAAVGCGKTAAPDGYKCSLAISGHGGQALTSPALLPIVDSGFVFSVSAWVNVTKCSVSCEVISEDGASVFQFALKYQRVCRAGGKSGACWKFTKAFTNEPDSNAASPPGSATLGKWTQLTGVFDSTRGQLLLYVNGAQAGTAPTTPGGPDIPGQVRIGNLMPGGTAHDWNGRISDVCLFFNDLLPADVKVAVHGDKAHPQDGCAALFAEYP